MSTEDYAIETRALSRNFGEIDAVSKLDLRIRQGTRFGLLGPNGAGKTTTVRMLSGLLAPTSGSATVSGYDISTQRNEVKAVTAVLPESPGVYSKLSAVEFLEFIGALNGMTGNKLSNRIDRILSLMGLETRQDDLLESYSSGMKQKVLVASTILHEPKLVFLDEPTSRLDPAASALVKDLIQVLAEETGTSFFICTHITSLAEDLCDMIGILNEGKLAVLGSPQDIVQTAESSTLEQAYLKILGGRIDRESLLAWR
ncbi:MAG: ABC transporter ATP-binding protein [Candidatus Thorarchaeota archaeon]